MQHLSDCHGYRGGFIYCVGRFDATIRLDQGGFVKTLGGDASKEFVLDAKRLTRVAVTWVSDEGNARPPTLVHPHGIEEEERWKRASVYQPKYLHHARKRGRLAEKRCVTMLRESGIYAEHGTPYEDERLGIDLWIRMFVRHAWTWFPVDMTFGSLFAETRGRCKLLSARERGVIPVKLIRETLRDPHKVAGSFTMGILEALEEMRPHYPPLMTRENALDLERSYT